MSGERRRLALSTGVWWATAATVAPALVLLGHELTGSFGVAGLAVGAFSVGVGLSAPVRGRLVDRRGHTRVIPWLAVGGASGLVLASADGTVGLVVGAALAGLCALPLIATARSLLP